MGTHSPSYGASPAIWDHTVLPATQHRWTRPTLTPATQAGTRSTFPRGMESWVDLGGWLYTSNVWEENKLSDGQRKDNSTGETGGRYVFFLSRLLSIPARFSAVRAESGRRILTHYRLTCILTYRWDRVLCTRRWRRRYRRRDHRQFPTVRCNRPPVDPPSLHHPLVMTTCCCLIRASPIYSLHTPHTHLYTPTHGTACRHTTTHAHTSCTWHSK